MLALCSCAREKKNRHAIASPTNSSTRNAIAAERLLLRLAFAFFHSTRLMLSSRSSKRVIWSASLSGTGVFVFEFVSNIWLLGQDIVLQFICQEN